MMRSSWPLAEGQDIAQRMQGAAAGEMCRLLLIGPAICGGGHGKIDRTQRGKAHGDRLVCRAFQQEDGEDGGQRAAADLYRHIRQGAFLALPPGQLRTEQGLAACGQDDKAQNPRLPPPGEQQAEQGEREGVQAACAQNVGQVALAVKIKIARDGAVLA